MEKNTISRLRLEFEDYAHTEDGIEFWYARDLQKLLGYSDKRNFLKVIEKAKESCNNSHQEVTKNFVEVTRVVTTSNGGELKLEDTKLTRYACYLIAQNGDPRKPEIAFSQHYFALQTRKQELIEERIQLQRRIDAREQLKKSESELSKLIYERGVNEQGFARIRSKGDEALFGKTTKEMKLKLNIPLKKPLADFLPTVTIAAKNLATEITNFNVKQDDLEGEPKITKEHVKNNSEVRGVLVKNKITPENLPKEEDIKKIKSIDYLEDTRITYTA